MKAGASDYVMKESLARLAPVLERELGQAAIRAEHRKGQIELEISRDRYVDLYELAPVGYLTLSADGLIEQLNLTGADMLGGERNRLLRTRFTQFVLTADIDRWHEHFAHVLHHGDRQRVELALPSHRGSCLYVQLDCMRAEAGSAAPMVRVARTAIKRRN